MVIVCMRMCPADMRVLRAYTPHLQNYCTCHQFTTMHHIRTPTGRHCCSFAQLNANGKVKARTHTLSVPRPGQHPQAAVPEPS